MKNQRAERLRTTVDFLPPETKRAMLEGLERNRIITGANTDRRGGMCPMIAADRNAFQSGPMADIFAAVWDSYNGACILNRRDASERDLRVLKTMLETSLANSPEFSSQLGQAWLDYHVGAEADASTTAIDFDRDLTTALEQSAAHQEAGSLSPLAPTPSPAPRKIELVYDGGPIPVAAPAPAGRSRIADQPTDRADARPDVHAGGTAMSSPYEPYTIAPPKRRSAAVRGPVDQRVDSRASRHAAQTNATVERAQARAIIANQAATLRGRDWPRSATPRPTAQPAAEAPRHDLAPTPLEVPAIRQAAIPQLRRPAQGHGQAQLPGGAHVGRPAETDDRSPAVGEGRTGWSWLPPFQSFDDYNADTAGSGLESDPRRDVPEPEVQQPSADTGRKVRG